MPISNRKNVLENQTPPPNDTDTLTSAGPHDIDLNGINVHYVVTGSGAPVILMHGWGCSSETVASIAATAAATHKVFNLDLPGFGRSDEPGQVWGVDDYARLVMDFADTVGIDNPVLVGHSFGGRIAIVYASSGRKVDSVVLVDAAGVKPRRPFRYYARVYWFKTMKRIVRLLMPRKKADAIIERMRNRRGSADYNSASPMMKSILSKVVNEDLCHLMPSIVAPTLLIWGERDTATPIADARKMERLIPDAGLVSFEGAGHYSFLDNPGGFRAVLASFLGSRTGKDRPNNHLTN